MPLFAALKPLVPRRFRPVLSFYGLQLAIAATTVGDRFGARTEGLPVPPARLRYRVHGAVGREGFLRIGERGAHDLARGLKAAGRDFASYERVLDFGCGCARVLRWVMGRAPRARLCGTDIDPEAIAWCRENVPGVTFTVNDASPPLPYEEASFDLVYGISVFTHLDEPPQLAWLEELRRVLRPGGIALLTTHGPSLQEGLRPDQRAALRESGFAFVVSRTGRYKLDGLPDFYQTAFHTEDYVRRQWARFFEVRAYLGQGMTGYQDLVVVEKK